MIPWTVSIVAVLLIALGTTLLLRRHRNRNTSPPGRDAAMLRAREAMTGLERGRRRAAKGSIRRGGSGNSGIDGTSFGGSSGSDGGL